MQIINDRMFGTPIMSALKKGIEGASVKQRAIANNLANISTPGYKRQTVSFRDELWEAMSGSQGIKARTTHPRHISMEVESINKVRPLVSIDLESSIRVDGNTVNIDQEMVDLAKNTGSYMSWMEILNRKYGHLKDAIKSGR